jgi:hypothetical protein
METLLGVVAGGFMFAAGVVCGAALAWRLKRDLPPIPMPLPSAQVYVPEPKDDKREKSQRSAL